MAWPFSNVVAPNLDSGIVAVPNVSTAVPNVPATSTPLWLLGAHFANTTNNEITVRLTDGSGATVVPDTPVPAKSAIDFEFPFMPLTGLKWLASVGVGLNGKAWGYY